MTKSKVITSLKFDGEGSLSLNKARECEFRFKRDGEDTIEHEGETLCRVVYDNGILGGYIGNNVSIKDSFISSRSKVYGGSNIFKSVIFCSSVYSSTVKDSSITSSDLIMSTAINSIANKVCIIRFIVKDSNILECRLSSKPSFYTGVEMTGMLMRNAKVESYDCFGRFLNIGSEYGTLYWYKNEDGGITCRRGCFIGTLEEFKEKVSLVHGDNKFGREYQLAIAMIENKVKRESW